MDFNYFHSNAVQRFMNEQKKTIHQYFSELIGPAVFFRHSLFYELQSISFLPPDEFVYSPTIE